MTSLPRSSDRTWSEPQCGPSGLLSRHGPDAHPVTFQTFHELLPAIDTSITGIMSAILCRVPSQFFKDFRRQLLFRNKLVSTSSLTSPIDGFWWGVFFLLGSGFVRLGGNGLDFLKGYPVGIIKLWHICTRSVRFTCSRRQVAPEEVVARTEIP